MLPEVLERRKGHVRIARKECDY